jgi:hypothetical protein
LLLKEGDSFCQKRTGRNEREGSFTVKGADFRAEKGEGKHKEKPKPIISSKEVVALPPSHLFKNEAATPLILKRKQRSLSLAAHCPLSLSSTQTFCPCWSLLTLLS